MIHWIIGAISISAILWYIDSHRTNLLKHLSKNTEILSEQLKKNEEATRTLDTQYEWNQLHKELNELQGKVAQLNNSSELQQLENQLKKIHDEICALSLSQK